MFLTVIEVFIAITVMLLLINRYLFCWIGFLLNKINLFDYKSVCVPSHNGYPLALSFRFEPAEIAREMSKNKNYKVNHNYNGGGTSIRREFKSFYGGRTIGAEKYKTVVYDISFQNRGGSFEGFNVGTSINNPKYSFSCVGGTNCVTPAFIVRRNIFLMIDDLPLTKAQKNEMKKNVRVTFYTSAFNFF